MAVVREEGMITNPSIINNDEKPAITIDNEKVSSANAPPTQRRPRIREVSSRFMTTPHPKCPNPPPLPTPKYGASDMLLMRRSHSARRPQHHPFSDHQQQQQEALSSDVVSEALTTAMAATFTTRSLDDHPFTLRPSSAPNANVNMSTETPCFFNHTTNNNKPDGNGTAIPPRKRPAAPARQFKENGGAGLRPDTPRPQAKDRSSRSIPRIQHHRSLQNNKVAALVASRPVGPTDSSSIVPSTSGEAPHCHKEPIASSKAAAVVVEEGVRKPNENSSAPHMDSGSLGNRGNSCGEAPAIAELVNMDDLSWSDTSSVGSSQGGGICDSPPIAANIQSSKILRTASSACRSSMPEADLLPTMGGRDGGGPCRSLNSAFSSCVAAKSMSKQASVMSRYLVCSSSSSSKGSGVSLPPHPSHMRTASSLSTSMIKAAQPDTMRKVKKASSHDDDVHMMKLLQNRYLQWRYANVKAESALQAQGVSAEKCLIALWAKIVKLHDSVERKRIELVQLKMAERLSKILEGQMPFLDSWENMEESYSNSLLGVSGALHNATLRLPVTGNVRADTGEVEQALQSAADVLEATYPSLCSFLPKIFIKQTEEMNSLASAVAGIVTKERALIEECGQLLMMANKLQTEECSLSGQLIQLNRDRRLA
ncbi:hypothetical protein AMTRI_Chr10g233500 [Amborella trichopoda]|uniref:AUGMIN subunit 8 isoform X1 n=1 Tax=Amborella trichopoda TaxID=13333 RepID=UPI0009C16140|nr:AUGMIN subunit 8 isoform X1 [Amborella trichopoda]|eukprot:XP_020531143.1 AUGMIN subunit 8 isoform X1 [Amborella trichopoda]